MPHQPLFEPLLFEPMSPASFPPTWNSTIQSCFSSSDTKTLCHLFCSLHIHTVSPIIVQGNQVGQAQSEQVILLFALPDHIFLKGLEMISRKTGTMISLETSIRLEIPQIHLIFLRASCNVCLLLVIK